MAAELKYGDINDTDYQSHRQEFLRFLEADGDDGPAAEQAKDMVKRHSTRFVLNLDDLRRHNREVAEQFLRAPLQRLAAWEDALRTYLLGKFDAADFGTDKLIGAAKTQADARAFRIAVDGNFGAQRMTPRTLLAHHITQLVAVEGIATKLSLVRPKVVRSVHYCDKTQAFQEARYHDATSISGFITSSAYPTKDKDDNPLVTEFGLSTYEDHQTLVIQEMPEKCLPGQMPRSVTAVLDGDLVDRCKPGDRVLVMGVYRAMAAASGGETTGNFRTLLIVNNVKPLSMTSRSSAINEKDVSNIRQIAKRKDVFDLLSRSIAPSIEGHAYVKKAMLLLLLGGVEKNLENGSHIRGDINLLMVGDPSTAKSQLLRFLLHLAPLAINTTGRGSTGVGLTAAVTTSRDTNDRVLEAGAMVLADRGIVCIDEFDKMSVADRVAIHEVMEQQTVTIAKAGIHMSLNARCSVVAAANPVYGQYDASKGAADNLGLPDSILSRFDAVFVILDEADKAKDMAISGRVLANHRFVGKARPADDDDDAGADLEADAKDLDDDTPVFQKYDKMLHSLVGVGGSGATGPAAAAGRRRSSSKAGSELVTIGFLKKFIEFTKSIGSKVTLTTEAIEFIVSQYTQLRSREQQLPITARTLETMIRLSTAHAKLRHSAKIERKDCDAALEIMNFALEHNTKPKERDADADATGADADADDAEDKDFKPKPKRGGGGGGGGGDGGAGGSGGKKDDDDDDAEGGAADGKRPAKGKGKPAAAAVAAAAAAGKKAPATKSAAAASPKATPRRAAAAAADQKRQTTDADVDADADASGEADPTATPGKRSRAGAKRKKAETKTRAVASDDEGDAPAAAAAAADADADAAADASADADADTDASQSRPKRQRVRRVAAAAPAPSAAAAAMEDDAPVSDAADAVAEAAAVVAEAEAEAEAAAESVVRAPAVAVDPARLEVFREALGSFFGKKQHVGGARYVRHLNALAHVQSAPFSASEAQDMIATLHAQGAVLYSAKHDQIHRTT